MKRSILAIIIVAAFVIVTGCGSEVISDEKTAEQYVEKQGYTITSRSTNVQKYVLDKSKLFGSEDSMLYQQTWGVQRVEPDPYMEKEISVYGFTVRNHPLETMYNRETDIAIMVCEGKVIGGTSFPVQQDELLMGWPYSLDGQTLEEVTGLTYQEWSANWEKKYGS
jgi:hypothetical protein